MDAAIKRNMEIAEKELKEYKKFFYLGHGNFGCVFGCLPETVSSGIPMVRLRLCF